MSDNPDVNDNERLGKVLLGCVIAIETVLTDDHVDLGVGAGAILGRVSKALKQELDRLVSSDDR